MISSGFFAIVASYNSFDDQQRAVGRETFTIQSWLLIESLKVLKYLHSLFQEQRNVTLIRYFFHYFGRIFFRNTILQLISLLMPYTGSCEVPLQGKAMKIKCLSGIPGILFLPFERCIPMQTIATSPPHIYPLYVYLPES